MPIAIITMFDRKGETPRQQIYAPTLAKMHSQYTPTLKGTTY